jgi:hypothetical protein
MDGSAGSCVLLLLDGIDAMPSRLVDRQNDDDERAALAMAKGY